VLMVTSDIGIGWHELAWMRTVPRFLLGHRLDGLLDCAVGAEVPSHIRVDVVLRRGQAKRKVQGYWFSNYLGVPDAAEKI
jgi:hypothetical protein